IKSPWIGLQVANTKKTQQVRPLLSYFGCSFSLLQVLAEDGVIERFVGHPRDAAAIRATFAGLWSINGDDPITKKLIKNYLIRAMQPVQLSKVVSELGVYGYALGDRGMAEVRQGGHLLRTKGEDVDEVRVPRGTSFKTFHFFHNYGLRKHLQISTTLSEVVLKGPFLNCPKIQAHNSLLSSRKHNSKEWFFTDNCSLTLVAKFGILIFILDSGEYVV
ncbi:unnamed protein product, partial [Strongylus vulgaris]